MSSSAAPPRIESMFDWLDETSPASAEVVVPIVLDLVRPASVVDVGCGRGAWLAVFRRHGVADVLGVDGAYVDRGSLVIPTESFLAADLSHPTDVGRGFDLALCLEVGEHLPESAAPALVETLTSAAPAVLFSAAIPGQGGVGHVNEQWPGYWAELFARRGYLPFDVLRPRLWEDRRVAVWYRQNAFLYARPELAAERAWATEAATGDAVRRLVHPDLFARMVRMAAPRNHSVTALLRALPRAAAGTLRRRLARRRPMGPAG
jgi:SAM-dependent methyltransferase